MHSACDKENDERLQGICRVPGALPLARVLSLGRCAWSLRASMLLFLYLPCPGGGMADAEDLKSSGDFSSCGFDSHPGHHVLKYLRRIGISGGCAIRGQITLTLP